MVGEEPAEQRTRNAGAAEERTEHALIPPALARADDVGDDRLPEDNEPARSDALHRSERDEHRHRRRHAAEHAADEEDPDRDLEQALAPEQVAEFPAQRR